MFGFVPPLSVSIKTDQNPDRVSKKDLSLLFPLSGLLTSKIGKVATVWFRNRVSLGLWGDDEFGRFEQGVGD